MDLGHLIKVAPTALSRAILFGVAGAFLMGFMVVNTVTSTSLGSGTVKMATETFADDADITIVKKGVKLIQTTISASAGAPGVDVTGPTLANVNNALTKNNYAYEFEVKESGATTLQSAENLKIEVYGDDGSTTTLLATLYTQQSSVDDANVEGAIVTVDLGSATVVHDNFDIIVNRQ